MSNSDAVTLAWIHNGRDVAYSFFWSFLNLMMWDSAHESRVAKGGFAAAKFATGGIVVSRRNVVREWLARTETPWLLMVDTDMGFPPDALERLLEVADPMDRPVVGGLTFAQFTGEGDGWGGYTPQMWPVLLRWSDDPQQRGFHPWLDYPRDQVVRADCTGAAFLLIHRSVFERLREPHGPDWAGWFDQLPAPRKGADDLSEDFSFCYRLREAGIPLHINTAVKTTHLKETWLREEMYFAFRDLEQQRRVQQREVAPTVAPATETVAVIVPVLQRPQNAGPFMESLRASDPNGLCTAYAIADQDDTATAAAWAAAGAWVVNRNGNPVTFPKKANIGYEVSEEAWLFLTGDDVKFHPGWLDQAMAVARSTGANVIATNDLGNKRVIAGEHATHPLIRRSYVDELGASWDGPGTVVHEGYRHWFCDNEWTAVAKQRGTFAAAKWAVVEHLHPYWGKAEQDDTYRLGESDAAADQATFIARLEANAAVSV